MADSFADTDSFYADFSTFLLENKIIKDKEKVKRLLIKRENIQSTAIGKGAATPHIFSDEFDKFYCYVSLVKEGLDFKAPDRADVFLVFLVMSDERDVGLHLKLLSRIARLVNNTDLTTACRSASTPGELLDILAAKEAQL